MDRYLKFSSFGSANLLPFCFYFPRFSPLFWNLLCPPFLSCCPLFAQYVAPHLTPPFAISLFPFFSPFYPFSTPFAPLLSLYLPPICSKFVSFPQPSLIFCPPFCPLFSTSYPLFAYSFAFNMTPRLLPLFAPLFRLLFLPIF